MRSLPVRVILDADFSFSVLLIYPAIPFWPAEFLLKDQLLSILDFPCMLLLASPLLLLILFLSVKSWLVFSMCLGVFLLGFFSVWDSLCLLDLIDYFLFHVGKIFKYNLLKNFLIPFFSSSSGTPVIRILVHLILSQRSLRLSSVFTLFTLFCSSEVISTILSSSLLIHPSTSNILLLIPSRVFLISVIVLFVSLYLLFNFSRYLLINYFTFSICSQGF